MKNTPILMSMSMVLAILEGRKVQTRRIIQWPKSVREDIAKDHFRIERVCEDGKGNWILWGDDFVGIEEFTKQAYQKGEGFKCRYGKAGDRLWVKEPWRVVPSLVGHDFAIEYKADNYLQQWRDGEMQFQHLWENLYTQDLKPRVTADQCKWRSSLFMYEAFSRIKLEVIEVRAERLHNISQRDCEREGLVENKAVTFEFTDKQGHERRSIGLRAQYANLWVWLHGMESWVENPWVWIIDFERIPE